MWARRLAGSQVLVLLLGFSCGDGTKPKQAPPTVVSTCTTDAACETGRCDPFAGCVECLFDHDCGEGFQCEERECHAVLPCSTSDDCQDSLTPVCSDASETCVACTADADCPGTAHCLANRCEAYAPCTTSDDCAEGVCDVERSECVECLTGSECGRGHLCVSAHCETACKSEKDCSGDAPFCGPQGYCVECATHTHCPDVYHCSSGRCELDVCEGAAQRCDASARGIETCNTSGSGYTVKPCDPEQSCTAPSAEPACEDWVCEPESEGCSSDARTVELCSPDGLSVAMQTDCDKGSVCVDAECVPQACQPKKVTCDDGELRRCSDDGTENALLRRCASDELCSASEEDCLLIICEPDAPTCDGNQVRACNSDGTGFEGSAEACGTDEACFDGGCLPRVCISDFECDGQKSLGCLDNGTRLATDERCDPSGEVPTFCNADTGRCESVGCDASQPICAGGFATVCADDGSGPVSGGLDCSLLEQACFNGNCEPVACTDQYVCQGSDLYRCADNGTALDLSGECGRPELCDALAGTCLTEVCTPGDPVCNDTIATTCDETGAGYEPGGTDCADSDQGCFAGGCLPLVCVPNSYYCSEGDVLHCDGTGTQTTVADICYSGEHCATGEVTCQPNLCSPGAAVCTDTVATTCADDGSGPNPGGTDCAALGKTCSLGTCEDLVCEPGKRFCEDGNVRLCSDTGTASGPYDACLPNEYCDSTDPARCRPDRCTANAATCSGESEATCNDDGSGYATVGTDCTLYDAVCSLTGCASTANDDLGGLTLSSENPMSTLYLTALEVLTPRTITELAIYLDVVSSTDLVWLVYDSATMTGNYDKLFELTTSAVSGPAAYRPSGAVSIPLEADHYYAIGVLVRGAHTEYQSAGSTPPTSFSAIVGVTRFDTTLVPAQVWIDGAVGSGAPVRVVTK